jgi:UDP-N-acetylmuramate: L-alanyl-gamma-D-glutamyl-meso-diaminopimelate ligase
MPASAKRIHFLGISGTAMGSVAAALKDLGCNVTGSDENVYPPMSTFLTEKGITFQSGYAAANLPPDADVIVVGNAIRRGNPEVEEVLNRKLYYLSLPEVLKEFFLRGKHNLVVTGTHGKTTTTSLLTWIFEKAGKNPSYMIGGIPHNLSSGARFTDSRYFIIEGDEYDTAFFDKRSKFIHYLPELVIVNNIEFDHADIYRDLEEIKLSFRRMLNIVPGNGMVLLNSDDANCVEVGRGCPAPLIEVGFSANAANRIRDARFGPDGSSFILFDTPFELSMGGEFNVRNAAMAISAAHFYGIPLSLVQTAVAEFRGVKRRQETRGTARGVTVIDDFGHHPTAIRQTLQSLRHRFPGHRLWAIFEPRSNTTRRSVFQTELPAAFELADGVLIAQVARLEQIPQAERLNPQRVIEDLLKAGKKAFYEPGADEIVKRIVPELGDRDVVVVFSNGGFDNIHSKLLDALAE